MKCNNECPFYVKDSIDISPWSGAHKKENYCKLNAKIIIDYKEYTEIDYSTSFAPIYVNECSINDQRIAKMKELLGETS